MDTKEEILSELARLYPNAKPALHFNSPYELLVAVVLSAQCTDEVPKTREELETLAGVGRKTANVVYAVAFGGNAIAVDTHVFRVANRLGLAIGKTPFEVEKGLMAAIPEEQWGTAHHWLIWHGRRVCHSQRPDCLACTLQTVCPHYQRTKGEHSPERSQDA